jgi:YD repeat-containing protein
MKASPRAPGVAASALICAALTATLVDGTMAQTAGSVIYQYDSVGRIVQDANPGNTGSYTYDAAGNRTTTTISAGSTTTTTVGTSLSPAINTPQPSSAASSPLQ